MHNRASLKVFSPEVQLLSFSWRILVEKWFWPLVSRSLIRILHRQRILPASCESVKREWKNAANQRWWCALMRCLSVSACLIIIIQKRLSNEIFNWSNGSLQTHCFIALFISLYYFLSLLKCTHLSNKFLQLLCQLYRITLYTSNSSTCQPICACSPESRESFRIGSNSSSEGERCSVHDFPLSLLRITISLSSFRMEAKCGTSNITGLKQTHSGGAITFYASQCSGAHINISQGANTIVTVNIPQFAKYLIPQFLS